MQYHRGSAFIVLLVGLGLASLAVVQARAFMSSTTVVQEVPTVEVVVFKSDLPRGHVVTPEDLMVMPYVEYSTPDTFLREASAVVGAHVVTDVAQGQPAVTNLLSQEPIEQRPVTVRERRAGKTSSVCIARCTGDAP